MPEEANVQPAGSQEGAWSDAGIDALFNRDAAPEAPQAAEIAAPPPAADIPAVVAPAPVVAAPAPEVPAVEAPPGPPAIEQAAYQEAYDTVQKLGGAEEATMLHTIGAPLVAPQLDPAGFFTALEEQRGEAATDAIAWHAYKTYNFVETALNDPASITDPALRDRLIAFNQWDAAGRPAAAASQPAHTPAPAPAAAPVIMPALPEIDVEDLDLPAEARTWIASAQKALGAVNPAIAALQAEVNELKGYRESETQRQARETREATEKTQRDQAELAASREGRLYVAVDQVVTNLLTPQAWSTNPDPIKRAEEDKEQRADIDARVASEFLRDTRTNPEVVKWWTEATTAYKRGDFVGPRQAVQKIKEHVQAIASRHIARYGGRLTAAVNADAAVAANNGNGNRVVITGPGSGGAPNSPLPPHDNSKAWDNLDQQIDRAQARPRA